MIAHRNKATDPVRCLGYWSKFSRRPAGAGDWGDWALGGSPRLPHGEAKAVRGDWGTAGRAGLGAAPWVTAVTGGPRLVGVAGALGDWPPPRMVLKVPQVTGGLGFRNFRRRRKRALSDRVTESPGHCTEPRGTVMRTLKQLSIEDR